MSVTAKKKKEDAGYGCYIVRRKANELSKTAPKKSIETIAKEVILGKWGNEPEKKEALVEAGYDYDKVQKKVRELL